MSSVLERIVNYKRSVVANSYDKNPTELSKRSFKDAISQSSFGFIMECKKASPSKGVIRENFDLDEILSVYEKYADAISVLTEEKFFQGSYKNLSYVSQNTNKPVLCKDFIFDPKQVRLARYYGADAILLMLSVVTDKEYQACSDEAKKYGMDVLTEIHDENELLRAIELDSEIIGINNRNLKNLVTNLKTTKDLSKLIPKDRLVITESGIADHQDVTELAGFADACLVGSSLMGAASLEKAASELVYGDIKICGLTNQEDMDFVDNLDSSSLGIIFAESSKRKIQQQVSSKKKPLIGVFQNQSKELILNKVKEFKLDGVQLHGDESREYVLDLRKVLGSDFFISKAIHIKNSIPDVDFNLFDEVLLDTQVAQQQGGTGTTFDWDLLSNTQLAMNKYKIRIAGGIDENNIAQIKQLGFIKLDICTGSESEPGMKSEAKLKAIFNNARLEGLKR